MERELHVLFGAGQVGDHLVRRLLAEGKRVRVAKRSPTGLPEGVEVCPGDAADPAFCAAAAAGAATVYHCMNPPYAVRAWAELLPRFMDNLVAAAGRAGARLVVLDNVYMLGRPGSGPLDEQSPVNPCSRKGEIRARVAERLFSAHRAGQVRAVAGRASDFYGPGGTLTTFGDFFWPDALAGRTVRSPANPDTPHTYHYIPDVAAGLAALGTAPDDAYGGPWMLPCQPAEPTRVLAARLLRALGLELHLAAIPRWMLGMLGLFLPPLREIPEMLYQWDQPFVVSDNRFRARFGVLPASLDDAAAATVAWAVRQYGAASVGSADAAKTGTIPE